MARRHVVLCDRKEARQARFGGKQVVAILIQRSVRYAIADRQQLALRVEQETELHRIRHRTQCSFEREQALLERAFGCLSLRGVALPAVDGALCGFCPEE